MNTHTHISIAALLLLVIMAGCGGTLQVGIETTPTPNYAATSTLTALVEENAKLTTRVAQQVTPTPVPPRLGRLAYVQGGDIWTKELPDGKAQRLTTDGRNSEPQPRWSASGAWLAFRTEHQAIISRQVPCDVPTPRQELCREPVALQQRQVWVMDADGSRTHALRADLSVEAFAWAPTSDRLAFVTEKGDLQTVNADGSNLVTLVPHSEADGTTGQVGRIAWSPDGAWIAYDWQLTQAETTVTYQGLWKVSTNGKERVQLYISGAPKRGEAILAGWSPQGKRLLFWQSETRTGTLLGGVGFYAVSAEQAASPSPAPVQFTNAMLTYADFFASAPQDSPSGQQDVVAFVAGSSQATWNGKRIAALQLLTPKGIAAISPAWSPGGTRLAYVAMPESPDTGMNDISLQDLMQRHLWIVDASGEDPPRPLTNAGAYRDERPQWSADGNYILFARLDSKGRASLWIIAADGTSTRQVVEELTPAPDPTGFFGHVDWDALFDWWREPPG